MPLAIGDPAPPFTLPDAQGNPVSLSQFHGSQVVIYFYPRDNTPGCTQEACSFRDHFADYQQRGITILGISTDTPKSHQKFIDKYQLPFPLLSDETAEVSTLYGVYGKKKFRGNEYDGITRTTYVIDANGLIEHVDLKPKVASHGSDLLATL